MRSGRDSGEQPIQAFTTQIDPPWLAPARYLEFLNRVFPDQWNKASYDWYIARTVGGRRNELVVRAEGERVVSGIALSPRRIVVGTAPSIDVCVLTAAATLPSERGRGHYASLVQSALSRARELSYTALMGFVTRENASGRELIRLGAHVIPSYYVLSPRRLPAGRCIWRAAARLAPCSPRERRRALAAAFELLGRSQILAPGSGRLPRATFLYENAQEWTRQFIHRPHPVRILRLAHDSIAVIEPVGDTDRLHWLACPHSERAANIAMIAAASAASARKFFMYTLDPQQAVAAHRAGLKIREGNLLLLPIDASSTNWHRLVNAEWSVQSGDRS